MSNIEFRENYIGEDTYTEVKQLVCGSSHNLVLFGNKNLWGWGSNSHGQLGRLALGNILRPTMMFENVEKVVARNNHTLLLCNEGTDNDPCRFIYCMGDNTFAQLGNFDLPRYSEPVKISTTYTDIATINCISLGKRVGDNNAEIIEAWGLFSIEESKRNENGRNTKKNNKKVDKIIIKPTEVKCKSVNEYVERNMSLTYFWVHSYESSFLSRNSNETGQGDLIDQAQLKEVIYLSDDEEPDNDPDHVINVHIGDNNYKTGMAGCLIGSGGSITIEQLMQKGTIENRADQIGLFKRMGRDISSLF